MPEPTLIAVAVVRRGDAFLIQRRPAGVPLAGLWEFPGGKVRPGETPEQAAVRECQEETGLDVEVVGTYPDVVEQYDHDRLRLHFFACAIVAGDVVADENRRWVTASELTNYPFPAANGGLIAALLSNR